MHGNDSMEHRSTADYPGCVITITNMQLLGSMRRYIDIISVMAGISMQLLGCLLRHYFDIIACVFAASHTAATITIIVVLVIAVVIVLAVCAHANLHRLEVHG